MDSFTANCKTNFFPLVSFFQMIRTGRSRSSLPTPTPRSQKTGMMRWTVNGSLPWSTTPSTRYVSSQSYLYRFIYQRSHFSRNFLKSGNFRQKERTSGKMKQCLYSHDKYSWSKRGEKVCKKGKYKKIPLLKTKLATYSILQCSVRYISALIISDLMRRL